MSEQGRSGRRVRPAVRCFVRGPLSSDEAGPLQRQDHLVDGRWGHLEVALHVALGAESRMQEPKPLSVDGSRQEVGLAENCANQSRQLFRTRLSQLAFGNLARRWSRRPRTGRRSCGSLLADYSSARAAMGSPTSCGRTPMGKFRSGRWMGTPGSGAGRQSRAGLARHR